METKLALNTTTQLSSLALKDSLKHWSSTQVQQSQLFHVLSCARVGHAGATLTLYSKPKSLRAILFTTAKSIHVSAQRKIDANFIRATRKVVHTMVISLPMSFTLAKIPTLAWTDLLTLLGVSSERLTFSTRKMQMAFWECLCRLLTAILTSLCRSIRLCMMMVWLKNLCLRYVLARMVGTFRWEDSMELDS
jgi:hypothetical protein